MREVSGAESVQMMAHCIGSLTMLMSLALGLEGVRHAVASQVTLHPRAGVLNEMRAGIYAGNVLQALGIDTLTTDERRRPVVGRAALRTARCSSTRRASEECGLPFCRRQMFMYGETYDHDQLNDATHEHLHEAFGVANMTTFKQITLALREGHVVAADGADVYLPATDNLRLPISFLHGENNRLFMPEGSQLTYDYLTEANGPDLYTRTVVPGLLAHGPVHRQGRRPRRLPGDHGRARSLQLTPPRTNHSPGSTMTHPSMEDLFAYPLMSALTERRTRRIPRGFSVNAGSLTHESHNDPAPLTPLEEAILVTCITGITGITTHDGPLTKANGTDELGTPFLNVLARTGSSADNCQATHFFMINDDGIFLLKHPTGNAALEALNARPRKLGGVDRRRLAVATPSSARCASPTSGSSFPREWPYYLGWNAQASNVAGHHAVLPGHRLHLAVHQRPADHRQRARRQALDVHRRLAPLPPQGLRGVDGQDRRRAPPDGEDPLPAGRRAEVRAQQVRHQGQRRPAGLRAHPAHRLRERSSTSRT